SAAVGRDVPGIELGDGAHFARRPVHNAQSVGPDRENQVAGAAEKCFVHYELIVAVPIQALETGAVAAHTVHAWRGIAGELNPFGLERMKLWMNHGARKRDQCPAGAGRASGDEPLLLPLFDSRGDPIAANAEGTFAQLRAGEFYNGAF